MKNTVIEAEEGPVRVLENVVYTAARHLSARHIATLAQHPEAVGSALAAVAATLATGGAPAPAVEIETIRGDAPHHVSAEEAGRRLSAMTRRGPSEDALSSDEFAARMGFKTRQSAHNQLSKGRIVGWQSVRRGYVFPAAQLDERGQPPEGLGRIVPCFSDGYAAWVWLTTPLASLGGLTPLALLKRGESRRAITAAEGEAQGDFA